MATTNGASAPEQSGGPTSNLGKDEVAWFFVEQYYTTLSKTPEKLHLFYSKRSQFVYGQEAEVADVSVGRQNIQERIKSLGLSDTCKVRISNVDSQSSYDNIVIQVIGETSNKDGDSPKKFVQTFVLAQQPSGYFVLNDILRYLEEDGEEEQDEALPAEAPASEPETAPVEAEAKSEATAESAVEDQTDIASTSVDASAVDQKLEEAGAVEPDASVNGESVAESAVESTAAAPEAPASTDAVPDPDEAVRQIEEEDTKEPEKPVDPSPTPVVNSQAAPPAQPAAPAQPSKPMTWASRAAAAAGPPAPRPVVPLAKTATPSAQPRAAAPAATAPSSKAAPVAQATEAATASKEPSEWQTAGSDSKKHKGAQSISGPQPEKEGVLGYVKYVTEKVQHDDLKAALAQHGELVYFDINRAKSCAFVEFATTAGYQAAVAANPHIVNGESITVEPRRPKSTAYGGTNYNTGRGNTANRGGRGAFEGGRTGSQGGRGNFTGQTRARGGGASRGRGASQATNA
ncbi:hypothetical protein BX600DRAFT_254011 [Xylariales sp. PMI_506]|nr:hypothetical protein BX600DRAFT_254011 [Xylariales sp. PMI_506]